MPRHKSQKVRAALISDGFAIIPLTKGYFARVSVDDYYMVSEWNWSALVTSKSDGSVRSVYAYRRKVLEDGSNSAIYMHRCIIDAPPGMDVDHIDGNGLNNDRENLRIATRSQNHCNRNRMSNNRSGIKGVWWNSRAKKWTSAIQVDGMQKHLGYFGSIDDAAAAYSEASANVHGEFGRTS